MRYLACGLLAFIVLVSAGCGGDATDWITPQANDVDSSTTGMRPGEGDFNIKMPLGVPSRFSPDPNDLPPIKLRLQADSSGHLEGLRLNQKEFVCGDWDALRMYFVGILGDERGPGSLQEDIQIELDCDYHLRHQHVIDAITAVAGYLDENDNVVKLVEKIKFSPYRQTVPNELAEVSGAESVNPAESELARPPETPYDEPIELQLTQSGHVIIDGEILPMDAVSDRIIRKRHLLHAMGKMESEATIIIRADKDCPVGKIQQLIRICQEKRFEQFALRVKMM